MEPTDELWRRLKQWAHECAESDAPLPADDDCLKQARKIAQEVLGTLPPRAMDFYGTEACAMIRKIREERQAAAGTVL